jgi:Tfp pilus tip-associated adhesin PilY1
LEDASTDNCPGTLQKGWYRDLAKTLPRDRQWSKVTAQAAVDSKYVYFSAYSPTKSESCLADGKSNLIKLKKKCGTVLGDGASIIDLGVGVVGETTIYKGKSYTTVSNRKDDADKFEGGTKNIYKGEAEGGTSSEPVPIPPSGMSTESWRQVF